MRQIAEFVAVLACSLFTGAAVYVTFVEHPARMECGVEIAAAEFPPSYRRASVMQAILAAVGLLSSITAWLAGATFWWVVAGALLGAVIPFTLIVTLPINKKLLNPALDRRSAETGRLLARWGKLHVVRSVLGALALLLFLCLVLFAEPGTDYTYSRREYKPLPWIPTLLSMKTLGCAENTCAEKKSVNSRRRTCAKSAPTLRRSPSDNGKTFPWGTHVLCGKRVYVVFANNHHGDGHIAAERG
jgi:anthrone oxygenase-like protein